LRAPTRLLTVIVRESGQNSESMAAMFANLTSSPRWAAQATTLLVALATGHKLTSLRRHVQRCSAPLHHPRKLRLFPLVLSNFGHDPANALGRRLCAT